MHASRLPIALITLLLLGAGMLMLSLGNVYPLLVAVAGILLGALLGQRPGSGASAWISTAGALAIFLAGTPITGSPPEGLLISAVMAIYFICWIQQNKPPTQSPFAPTGPLTLSFYASLFLAFLLLRSRLFPFPYLVGTLAATLIILLSLALWELGRRSRLTQAAQLQTPTLPDWLGRLLVLMAIALSTFLLFRLPLPLMADASLAAARDLNLTADPPSTQKTRQRSGDTPADGRFDKLEGPGDHPQDEGNGGDADSQAGPTEPWARGQLPPRADLELSDEARFHLEFPDEDEGKRAQNRRLYLRAQTLGLFRDGAWTRAPSEGRWIEDGEDGNQDQWVTLGRVNPEQSLTQRIYLYNHLPGGALVGIPNVIAFRGDRVFVQDDDFLAIEQAGDVTYELISAPVYFEDAASSPTLAPGPAPQHFLERAQGLTFRDIDNQLLAPISQPDLSLKQRLAFVQRLFKESYHYSERIENPADHEPLANFLFHEKAGYCDHFAQAGAHVLRRLGVPSRVAYGYAGGLFDPVLALYTFRERDAHAWTEIFLDDHGWVIFDLVPDGEGANRMPEIQRGKAPTQDPLRRFRLREEAHENPNDDSFPGLASPKTDWEQWLEGIWLLRYLDLILGVTVALLLLAYAVRRWRQRSRDPESKDGHSASRTRHEPPGYFRDFCELFAHLGQPRAPGQTLREFCHQLQQLRFFENEFDALLDYHYRVEYEQGDRSRQTEKQFSKEVRDFRNRYHSR